ncbi:hypothetical protein ACMD2_03097 [Ananas comosus]|uniref:Uncharacterized protein n=1 Tax=Ananas comosus TaxID=4615 RepID=A0A199VJJ1_ANACO|nr:hypothetical protein ACMD2_03097 [Ananas comosus]
MGKEAVHEISSFRGTAAAKAATTAAVLWWQLFVISVLGGGLLMYWLVTYHPANEQMWMVPIGLILFATPVVVWFSDFASTV